MTRKTDYDKRLEEIADMEVGGLSDDEVLRLLAERKELQTLKKQYDLAQQKQEKLSRAEEEKASIEKELAHLNTLISPDKPDEELLHLIEERKTLEAKLDVATAEVVSLTGSRKPSSEAEPAVAEATPAPEEPQVEVPDTAVEDVPSENVPRQQELPAQKVQPEKVLDIEVDEGFGDEKIVETTLEEGSELSRYITQMRSEPNALGRILEGLPAEVRQNRVFMLEVAKIDPAYAMHYADKDALKRDEDFNLRVASTRGERNSGSVLAEMLPEARTGKVVMAAIRQDYRNVRFALPQMAEYDEMIEKAKKVALEKVRDMKESVDASFLIPKILQKDKAFMKKVEEILPKS